MLKSKIHRATVTQADLHYVGSCTIDAALMELAHYIAAPLPDPLPADLAFAACEMVAYAYDNRADPDAKPGLVPAAARIAARYRGVRA